MALEEYNKKRDFKQTSEPKGGYKQTKGPLKFVVQKHKATRLHYDFRLELNGVLKSWAVPKGPSLNPKNKRLAMMTEDHPMDYLKFEGIIPEGNYGAGSVMVWDIGTYHIPTSDSRSISEKVVADELERGNIKIFLEGEKLRGEFALVKLKDSDNAWLLIKHRDKYAKNFDEPKEYSVLTDRSLKQIEQGEDILRRKKKQNKDADDSNSDKADSGFKGFDLTSAVKSDMPTEVKPMLATLVDDPFDNEEWIFEQKLDGYRAIAEVTKKEVKLYSRNNLDLRDKYPKVVEELKNLPFEAVLDGEIVVEDSKHNPSFQLLQEYPKTNKGNLKYHIFDILYFNGFDLRNVPLIQRKKIINKLIRKQRHINHVKFIEGKGIDLFKKSKKNGEGIIAKKKDSIYEDNARSNAWLKIKARLQQEAIICGYTEPKGSREFLGALVLGMYMNGNDKNKNKKELVHVGSVGTGFNSVNLKELKAKLLPLEVKKYPFKETPIIYRNVHWVRPKLVCEIEFAEWTKDKQLRQASFLGLREDKSITEVKKEKPADTEKLLDEKEPKVDIKISNPTKVYWPKEGYTKLDLISFYKDISDFLLPYLKDRPQSLHRQPNGISDKGFFQKDVDGLTPEWIETVRIPSDSKDKDIRYILCQNIETLIFMVNWGCIEINPWNSRVQSLDSPDYVVFDLDPLGVQFDRVVEVALELRTIFESIEIPSYVKTSGSRGMHVYVPLKPGYTYEQAQQFSKVVELIVNSKLPDLTSLERSPTKRRGRVYLDYLQNSRGKTMASVYSVRPRPGATVSTPLGWDEVNKRLDPSRFTIKTLSQRLDRVGDLWGGMDNDGIDMQESIDRLNNFLNE